jgi:hypothetical protein
VLKVLQVFKVLKEDKVLLDLKVHKVYRVL